VLEPGKEALVPEPHFPSYKAQIAFAGGEMVYIPTSFEDGFILRPEAVEKVLTPKTKILIVNTPNNPTGSVIPGQVLDDLAEIAVEHDLLVLSDEVYDRLVFKGRHESIYTRPGMPERTVVVNSFSKTFAMTGWRLGYAYGPAWLIEEMLKVVTYQTSCASSVSQRAALAALRADQGQFEVMWREFRERCDLAFKRLKKMPGIRVHPTAGSFYVFPNITEITSDCERFALDLLAQEQVVVVPGEA
jgi:aspartate/methionine/tyrosine aminotransferase